MGPVAPLVPPLTSRKRTGNRPEGGGTVDNAPNLVDGDATKTDTKSTASNKASDKLGGE